MNDSYVSFGLICYFCDPVTHSLLRFAIDCRCWEDLSGFLGVFFLAFGAFVQMFYLILYTDLDEFKHLLRSFETCFTIMLNKFDFGKIKVKMEFQDDGVESSFFFFLQNTQIILSLKIQ